MRLLRIIALAVILVASTGTFYSLYFNEKEIMYIESTEYQIESKYDPIVIHVAKELEIVETDKLLIMQLVVDEAFRQGVNPFLCLSVAFTESSFNINAVSHAGAVGVMQLMPIWGKERHELDSNIRIGVSLLSERIQKYGSEEKALKYYNGGWKAFSEKYPRIQRKTTRYASKVINLHNKLIASL